MKYVLVLCLITLATFTSGKPSCAGCPSKVEGNDLVKLTKDLNKSLLVLATGEGPSYKLVKINSATTQIVSGSKHVINADLMNQDEKTITCDMEIWSQPWLINGTRFTLQCPGENELVKIHSA